MTSQPSSPNPFADNPSASAVSPAEGTPNNSTTGREAYNIVSDTVVGMNVRKSDNLFQLKVILACVLMGVPLGAIAGALLSDSNNRLVGALLPSDHVPLFWLRRRFEREFPDTAGSSPASDADAWSKIERELFDLALLTPPEDEGGQLVRTHPHMQRLVRREMSAEEIAARQQTLDVLVDARVVVLNQEATYRRQDAQWELEPLGALAELWADL